jgi:hypothetical protein
LKVALTTINYKPQNHINLVSLVFLPTKLSVLLKIIFFISLKTTKITSKSQISEVCDVGHVTYNFINMLFISTGMFYDKLRPQMLSVGTTANSPLTMSIYWPCIRTVHVYVVIHFCDSVWSFYNYLCNPYLLPLKLWVRIPLRRYNIM